MFARDEYQKYDGNLTHINAMIRIDWDDLNEEQRYFVQELVRASVYDIFVVTRVTALHE